VPHRKELPVGVMVETPAAAIAADTFVGEADFFSIGTNDLTQYTLAVDRGNANLASRFLPLHPGVLRLIRRVVDVGAEHDIEVAVCGEMASQPIMAFALIGLGVRQLSVAPQSVPLVKRVIRGVSASVAASALAEALVSTTPAMAEEILNRCLVKQFGDDPFLHDGLPDL
jgi:phosphotransferase system enzyme I (PtsI)